MPGRPPDDHDPAVAATPAFAFGNTGHADDAEGPRKGPRRVRTGDTLGRYELGDELGEGGMATVFRARDRELRRDVAVKVLFPHLARRPDIVRRFHREARAAAGLEHPNILRIYDVGGGDGGDPPYIVMELIRGRTLLQEIEQRGAMLAEVVACVGALLGDALAAAHAAGVIHRDVKPANILIAPGGRLLLGDFGVARLETEDSLITRTGALLGTPAYMSPEQATGDTATTRSDLYSLGATLYQLATATLPFSGPPAKVLSAIIAGTLVPPVRRRASAGPDLSRLIERVMATDPGFRPAAATVLAAELRALATAGGLGDPSEELAAYFEDPDGFLRARTPVVVAAVVAAAGAAIADAKLPRAMALADRASALAADDPAVTALVRAVTEGGHASRRKRLLAMSSIALAAAGGVTALIWQLASAPADPPPDPHSELAAVADPSPGSGAIGLRPDLPVGIDAGELADAAPAVAPLDPARPVTAGERVSRAPDRRRPAIPHEPPPPRDAATEPPGAAEPARPEPPRPEPRLDPPRTDPPPDAASDRAVGHIVVHNDLWCDVWIDGIPHGSRRNERIEVTAGHHTVRCVNPAGEWTQGTEVAPGMTRVVTGAVLQEVEVTLAIDASIDGKAYTRGTVVKLKPRNVEVIAGGKKQFITFRASCTLRDVPDLGCYL